MPSVSTKRIKEIAAILRQLQIKFTTVPSIYELTTGQADVAKVGRQEWQLSAEVDVLLAPQQKSERGE